MASKMKGRDLNGMRAAGWSRPNLAAIKSVKVDKKCSNEELLAAIRKIVCESVIQLRGSNADDKYRNIVDMLMLRIRGALAQTIEQLEDDAETVDTEAITQSVVDATTELIESKIDPKNGLILISKDSLALLANEIVEAISDSIADEDADDAEENDSQQQAEETKQADEVPDSKNDAQQSNEKKQDAADVSQRNTQAAAKVADAQHVSQADVEKLRMQLDKSFEKIESLIQSNANAKPALAEASAQDAAAVKPVQAVVEVEKSTKDANDKLQEKTAAVPSKKDDKKKSKLSDVLTGKQYNALMKTLATYQQKVIGAVMNVSNAMADSFDKLHKALDKIYDKLNSNKISWLAILAGISLILIPLFWDKIKSFFSAISQKFDLSKKINDAIDALLNAIDWNGHVSTVVSKVWEAVKNAFSNFIQSPFDSITKKFTGAYEAIIEWTKDIWAYIKGKLSWTKQKQDENEEKAEKNASQSFSNAMAKLEQHTDANVKQTEEVVDNACTTTNADVAQKTAAISQDVQKLQQDSTQQITATSQDIQDNQRNISNVVLPGLDNDLHSSVDNAEQKCNEKTDSAITASESKLNSALDDLDKTIKENGAPTSVDHKTISKMDAAADGTNISSSRVDQAVKMPSDVVQTAAEEQGKTVQLYAKRDDVNRAASESKEVAQFAGTASAVPNVTNVNMTRNSTQAKFESKVLVNGTGNPAGSEAKVYEDMNAVMTEASRNCTTVEAGLDKSQKSLDALNDKVNDYFSQLNGIAKAIKDKPPAQQNSNVVMFPGWQQDGVCMEGV